MSTQAMKYVFFLAVACSLFGCSDAGPRPRFAVKFRATTDDGLALPGVAIGAGSRRVGITNGRGELDAELDGAEGESLAVRPGCPATFTDPEQVQPLKLTSSRRIVGENRTAPSTLLYDVTCTRKDRDIVVVARAENLAGVPVLVDGKPAGLTDASGDAHVLLPVAATATSLRVVFDTSARPELLPRNPGKAFALDPGDDILTFEQKFSVAPKQAARVTVRAKHIPVHIE